MPAVTLPRPKALLSAHDQSVRVIIIGSGVAGLSTALALSRQGLPSLVLTKRQPDVSNTACAQGGIACVLSGREESIDLHVEDTLSAGDHLCDPTVVKFVAHEGAAAIRQLVDDGCQFDLDASGEIHLGQEAAHSERRILHAGGDATGAEVARAQIEAARRDPLITIESDLFALDLISDGRSVNGIIASDCYRGGAIRFVKADAVVIATGGCGQLYRESSNAPIATGDGHAMAIRAGAVMRDLELIQFHPTIFYVSGAPRILVTEAIRGAGAVLRRTDGERFMLRYDLRGELAPRDIVSRAIVTEMRNTQEGCVFLDVSPVGSSRLRERFPKFLKLCAEYGIDPEKSWVPVRPGPHYMIGGAKTDLDGRTSLAGLYAVGEASSSGLHGANRLASNSLLEGLVLGSRCGQKLAQEVRDISKLELDDIHTSHTVDVDFEDMRATLRFLMDRCLGVERDPGRMGEFLRRFGQWQELLYNSGACEPKHWELMNMVEVGHAMTKCALARAESRGVHWRSDQPERNPARDGQHIEYTRDKGASWR